MPHNLRRGNSPDIIDSNVRTLKDAGYSEANATRVALRYAKKDSSAKKAAEKVALKSSVSKVRLA